MARVRVETLAGPDCDLVRAAQRGDLSAFAVLTERHRPALRATAITLLGYGDEADDAVQDAIVLALRRIGQLRDPASAGSWLRAIVRNTCRSRLRLRRPMPVAEPELYLPPSAEPGPEEVLDGAGERSWVRQAVATLSDPVREVMLLRYFTGFSSYEQIARLCGIPVDVVGGRLRDGRRILARRLRESAGDAYAATDAQVAMHRRTARQHVATMLGGGYGRVIEDWFRRDASVVVMGGLVGDRATLGALMDLTLNDGVGLRLHDAVGSRGVLVWETDFLNPASDPEHCPPTMAWLLRLEQGRVVRLGITYGGARNENLITG